MSYRAPPGRAMRSVLPARRQAAGARAAWSQPSNPPPTRPRCSSDAGTLGRHGVPASQKAGDAAAGLKDCSADVSIIITLRARIHRTATPAHSGWVAGAEAPAYSSELTIALLGRIRIRCRIRNRSRSRDRIRGRVRGRSRIRGRDPLPLPNVVSERQMP